ncbi:hypothetical protein DY000_02048231 [Brassica cretica]|uniref:Uncharacterized protein n=1 Tax=Brassica cretica TaxID=69181 RepID=A0ABQ7EVN3_BRACR|nr:hypothetical protein DY000_02048231 [Brassica cretica]
MPVLTKSGQSASQEEAVEEMKDCRSIKKHWCRSTMMPERGPSIFQDHLKPRSQTKYMPISTRSSKDELLFFSDPARLERSIRKEKRTSSIDTTSTTSIDTTFTTSIDTTSTTLINTTSTTSIDTCDRATIDSSTRTSIDTNPRADMVATLVLQRDENGDLHDPGGQLCNAAGQRIDGQGTAILEPFVATEDAKLIQITSLQYQNQRRSTLALQHRSTSSPENRSTIRFQHRTTLSIQNRSTQSLQHRSTPSDFQKSLRLKSLSLGEGPRIERRKRKGM